jgi:hypothetical protein
VIDLISQQSVNSGHKRIARRVLAAIVAYPTEDRTALIRWAPSGYVEGPMESARLSAFDRPRVVAYPLTDCTP